MRWIGTGSQPTYEGLKLATGSITSRGAICSQPTYEGLKHKWVGIWYKDNAQFPAYLRGIETIICGGDILAP